MNILLTNDDGVHAQGIQKLYAVLSDVHTTFIIAPDDEQSACSNAITTHRDVKITRISKMVFSVDGYPADCVNIGLHGDIIPTIDIIISGINHGPNVGNDVVFSGTVAGARTAFIFGKSGIALSLDCYHQPSKHFIDAARFLLDFIENKKDILMSKPHLLNINYPNLPDNQIHGVKYTHLGHRIYHDIFDKNHLSDNEILLKSQGSFDYHPEEGSDVTVLKDGYISITPLTTDCTDSIFLQSTRADSEYGRN